MTPPDDSALIAEAERLASIDVCGDTLSLSVQLDIRRPAMRQYHRLKSENWQPEDEAAKVWQDALDAFGDETECRYPAATAVIRAALDKAKSDEREACAEIADACPHGCRTAKTIRNRGDKS